jgi:hypothetical protein
MHGYLRPGVFIPNGGVEPAGSGTGLPVRFVRKPVEFEFQIKNPSATGSNRYTGRLNRYTGLVRLVTGRLTKKSK